MTVRLEPEPAPAAAAAPADRPLCGRPMRSGNTCVEPAGHRGVCHGTARRERTREEYRQAARRRAARARGVAVARGVYMADPAPAARPGPVAPPLELSARGACRWEPDPDRWFSDDPGDQAAAVAVCRGCPVRPQCAAWALETRQGWGVWGALTERDRRRLLRPAS